MIFFLFVLISFNFNNYGLQLTKTQNTVSRNFLILHVIFIYLHTNFTLPTYYGLKQQWPTTPAIHSRICGVVGFEDWSWPTLANAMLEKTINMTVVWQIFIETRGVSHNGSLLNKLFVHRGLYISILMGSGVEMLFPGFQTASLCQTKPELETTTKGVILE